jgi:hypothetical protein
MTLGVRRTSLVSRHRLRDRSSPRGWLSYLAQTQEFPSSRLPVASSRSSDRFPIRIRELPTGNSERLRPGSDRSTAGPRRGFG